MNLVSVFCAIYAERFCLTFAHICMYTSIQGLKRSVTTLRGGSLGYAEIVAVKVLIQANAKIDALFDRALFPYYFM